MVFFHFYSNSNGTFCEQTVPCSAASDGGLRCLPMSHKKDASLIWAKCISLSKRHRQEKTTQIRLLLRKQSDQDLPCFLF